MTSFLRGKSVKGMRRTPGSSDSMYNKTVIDNVLLKPYTTLEAYYDFWEHVCLRLLPQPPPPPHPRPQPQPQPPTQPLPSPRLASPRQVEHASHATYFFTFLAQA